MDKNLLKHLQKKTLEVENIVGYSKKLQPRIKESTSETIHDEQCIRFYVKRKIPLQELHKREIIPRTIQDIPTDIVTVGEIRALDMKATNISKTQKIRPVVAGISIGNYSITAGTFGWFYKDKKNNIVGGTNAHVCSEDPSKKGSEEKRITQPGKYDKGTIDDIIGYYIWHKRIVPIGSNSDCTFSNGIVRTLNFLSRLFNRNTRFSTYKSIDNHIDFGVFSLNVPYKVEFIDYDTTEGFYAVGHGFAGSDSTSIVCKGEYILQEGYRPLKTDFYKVEEGDVVYKTGRTSCLSSATVIDSSGVTQVGYGNFTALFDDIIITKLLLKPGDSGSCVWKKER